MVANITIFPEQTTLQGDFFRPKAKKNVNLFQMVRIGRDFRFYTSKTNERLHDPSTLLYTFGDLYIVDEVIRELQK